MRAGLNPIKTLRTVVLWGVLSLMGVAGGFSQNLIPNPGFEAYESLPGEKNGFAEVKNWFDPGSDKNAGSPGYFHTKGKGGAQLPNTNRGKALPESGDAIAGFVVYNGEDEAHRNYREYLSVRLTEKLIPKKLYRLSFYVTCGLENHYGKYGSDHIGAYFSTRKPTRTGHQPMGVWPQVVSEEVVYSTFWEELIFEFEPAETLEYITIGNFAVDDDLNLQVRNNSAGAGQYAYYFIDQVSLVPVDAKEDPFYLYCPDNIEVLTAPGVCHKEVPYALPDVVGSEDVVLKRLTGKESGQAFPIGTTEVSYSGTDLSGFKQTCKFNVTVIDQEPPVLKCPGNIVAKATPGKDSEVVNYFEVEALDNCSELPPKMVKGLASGSAFPMGETQLKFTAKDVSGNEAECEFSVLVEESAPQLTLVCPQDIRAVATPGKCSKAIQYPAPIAQGPTGINVKRLAGLENGAEFPVGTTKLTFEATEAGGQLAKCEFSVVVVDEEPPVLTCPEDMQVKTESGANTKVVEYPEVLAIDNCSQVTASRIVGLASGAEFPIGKKLMRYTGKDAAGNKSECSFKITVEETAEVLTLTCPENIKLPAAPGKCEQVVTYDEPEMSGPEDAVLRKIGGKASGSSFPRGTTVVFFEASDKSGQKASCEFNVNIVDEESPVIECPSDIRVKTEAGESTSNVAFPEPTATDNCDAVSVKRISGLESGADFPIGKTVQTYEVIDESGNPATCSFSVMVEGTAELLSLTCPENLTVSTDRGQCEKLLAYTSPAMSGPEDARLKQLTGAASGSVFQLGTHELSFEASDQTGQRANCQFTITVRDEEPPTVKCPADFTVKTEPGEPTKVVEYTMLTGSDNCEIVTPKRVAGLESGASFPIGQTEITYSATDKSGNTADCSFKITVEGTAKLLTLKCPEDMKVGTDPGKCESVVSFSQPEMVGPEDAVLEQINGAGSGSSFPKGTTELSFEASDKTGQKASCQFSISIADGEAPVVQCPADIVVKTEPGESTKAVQYTAATATDNCDEVTPKRTGGLNSGSPFPIGQTQIIYTAVDKSGNTSDCSFNIRVEGTAKLLTLKCPEAIKTVTNPGKCESTVTFSQPEMAGPGDAVLKQINGPVSGSIFPKGTSELSFEASDKTGQKASCQFSITVIDEEAPVVQCPSDLTVKTEPGETTKVVDFTPATVTDNCDEVPPKRTAGLGSGSSFPIGQTQITYSATDKSGNTADCSFNILVEGTAKLLTLNCPENLKTVTDPGKCESTVTFAQPEMIGPDDAVLKQVNGATSGSTFPKGTTELSFEASDKTGKKASCQFSITVTDEEPPVVKCPTDIAVKTEPGESTKAVDYIAATSTDNCDEVTPKRSAGLDSGSSFPIGQTQITYSATDKSGNTAQCSFKITVEGTAKLLTLKCPESLTQTTDNGKCEATVTFSQPEMTGPEDAVLKQTKGLTSGSTFPKGTTELSFEASDKTGQKASCQFSISVTDEEPPVVNCPTDIAVKTEPGESTKAVDYSTATATDNCDEVAPKPTAGLDSGSPFPIGQTQITYSTTDKSGNKADCSFNITVEGTAKLLTLKCPESLNKTTDSGKCGATVNFPQPEMTGPDDAVLKQIKGEISGSTFSKGTTELSFEASDKTGQKASCQFTITVTDEESPLVKCPTDIAVKTEPGETTKTVDYTAATATDNCDEITPKRTAVIDSGSPFPVGQTKITYSATDKSGNTADCSFNITVEGTAKLLTLKCPEDLKTVTDQGKCEASVTFSQPEMTGPADAVLKQTKGPASGSTFPKGTTELSFEASDKTGQKASCQFSITVTDEEPPVVKCPTDIAVKTEPGETTKAVDYIAPTAIDNCDEGAPKRTAGIDSGSPFPIGQTKITYSATDKSGNTADCSFNITVEGTAKLLTLKCPEDLKTITDEGKCEATVTFPQPEMTGPDDAVLKQIKGGTSGTTFPKGTTELSFEASDKTGQKASCQFSISVTDEEAPVVKCPSDIAVKTEPGETTKTVDYTAATATDNCDEAAPKRKAGLDSGSQFTIGQTQITYSATDKSGNTSDCSFNITVEGTAKVLTLKCPESLNKTTDSGKCGATVNFPQPEMTGPDDAVLKQIKGETSGSTLSKGTTELSFEASDKTGQKASCQFTITVTDEESPLVKCPMDIAVKTEPGEATKRVEYTAATATDNCDEITSKRTAGIDSGSPFPIGQTKITYSATDKSGNTADCSFNITVEGTAKLLTLKCPEDLKTVTDQGKCEASVTFSQPEMKGPEGAVLKQTKGEASGTTFPKGTTELSFEASDKTGQKASCQFSITVTDEEQPVVKCPTDIAVKTEPGESTKAVDYIAPTTIDNCDEVIPKRSAGLDSGSPFTIGQTKITYSATDKSGNTADCSFNITVEGTAKLLTLKCPEDLKTVTDQGKCEASVTFSQPEMTGPKDAVLKQVKGSASSSKFPKGTTELSFEASDKTGQKASCQFSITITDEEPPVVKCPSDISVKTEPGETTKTVDYTATTAIDNCDEVIPERTAGPDSGSPFPIGQTQVTYSALDQSGNSSDCSFNITVEGTAKLLTLKCSEDIKTVTDQGKCESAVSFSQPEMIGPNDAVLEQIKGGTSGSAFPKGTTELSFEASDKTGQKASCQFSITITDEEPPVVKCPSDISVKTEPGETTKTVDYTAATAIDNCHEVIPKRTAGLNSGSPFPIGQTKITYSVTDKSGNTADCSFNITVEGTAKLLTLNCPEGLRMVTDPGKCESTVSFSQPEMTGPDDALLEQIKGGTSGSTFPKGTTELSFEASDKTGQKASCQFSITVEDEETPVVKCPSDIQVKTEPGESAKTVDYTGATATDNCGEVSSKRKTGLDSGSPFPIGQTQITYSAADKSGNTAECSFNVTVEGTAKLLTLKCPEDLKTVTDQGKCEATITFTQPEMTGPDDAVLKQIKGGTSGSTFPKGTTELSFEASDKTGQKASCQFSITVEDEEAPVVKCPSDIQVKTEPGESTKAVDYTAATATDNCDEIAPKRTTGLDSGSPFPIGQTKITYSATDKSGNTADCSFNITVEGTAKLLTLKCPEDLKTVTDQGKCEATVTFTQPEMTGPDDAVLKQIKGGTSGSTFPKGTTELSFEASDKTGQKASCQFSITVTDEEEPVIRCPTDIAVKTEPGESTKAVDYTAATATDNCDEIAPKRTAGLDSGSPFPIGQTKITYSATDQSGNTAECSFNVTVEGTAKLLTLKCPEDLKTVTDQGKCEATITFTQPELTGPDDAVLKQIKGGTSGSTFPKGTTELSFEASDKTGQKASCQFTITVTDEEEPVIRCPTDIAVKTEPGESTKAVDYTAATATDNCDEIAPKRTAGLDSGSPFPIGQTKIIYSATDKSGNTADCSFNITVEGTAKLLTLKCPEDLKTVTDQGKCEATVTFPQPEMTGPDDAVLKQIKGGTSGTTFPKGTTELSFEASDKTGQKASCQFSITITDEEPPVVKCPSDIGVKTEPGETTKTVDYTAATATDNCDEVAPKRTAGLDSGSRFPIGQTKIIYSATDKSGNTAECSFNITVEGTAKLLTLNCPEDLKTVTDQGKCAASVTFSQPEMTGPKDAVLKQVKGSASSSKFPKGTTELSFEASDKTGQKTSCQFSITITDEEPPVVKCPSDISVKTEPGETTKTVDYTATTAIDNCDEVIPERTAGLDSGSPFPIGQTQVTYSALDQSGNSSDCSFNITVEGTAKLLTLNCPEGLRMVTDPGKCETTVSFSQPEMTGPDDAVLEQIKGGTSGSTFPKGTTELSFEASDKTGQKASCQFSITVEDEEAPVVKCPSDIQVKTEPGESAKTVDYSGATATDNCGEVSSKRKAGLDSGSPFPIGQTQITYSAADKSGNTAECSFNVTVEGTAKLLTLKCPEDLKTVTDQGKCEATITFTQPELTGPDDAVLKQIKGGTSGSTFPKGTTELSFEASDKTGQKASCQFSITVTDEEAPVVKCPSDIATKTAPGGPTKTVDYTTATTTDNCDEVTPKRTAGLDSGSPFPIGQTKITYSATDKSGNTAECNFTITVEGTAKLLTLKCPESLNKTTDPGKCEAKVTFPQPEMTGPDDALLKQISGGISGSTFPKGTTELSFEASDKTGQKATCQFSVTISDEEPPQISCPADIKVKAEPGATSKVVSFPAATATDNCGSPSIDQTSGLASGSKFPVGETEIVIQATDEAGNQASCTVKVEVETPVKLLTLKCPDDIRTATDPGKCEKVVFFHAPDMSGPSDATLKRLSGQASGKMFPIGETKIGFAASEPSGQERRCGFTVTVVDEEAPKIVCQGDTIVYPEPGEMGQLLKYTPVRATDNCGNISPTLVTGPGSGENFEAGKTNVKYSATDEAGNTAQCSFEVTVEVRPKDIEGEKVVYDKNVIMIPSGKCYIYYYDHIENDGDIVSINVDGEWVVESERIRKKKEDLTKTARIEVNLEEDKLHYVIFRAIDEGKTPPCTLSLAIYNERNDFLRRQKIRFKIGESGGITLKRK